MLWIKGGMGHSGEIGIFPAQKMPSYLIMITPEGYMK